MNCFTRTHLSTSLAALHVRPSRDLFAELAAAYSAPDRHYHTARHIDACLAQVQHYRSLAVQPAEIEIALWFHDAIYDTHRNDNEQRSADWASDLLASEGADTARVSRIHALIMATRHAASTDEPDQQLLVDIDLGILGQRRAVFDDYDEAIRREYHWVPSARYAESRIAVLTGFLDRPFIYTTAPLRDRFETQARRSIAHAIARLKDARR
jgi:predicted metal-dependent HD superfamily phosphohydrolase